VSERVHHSWLAAGEKRLLVAIATRLPAWVTSDRLTALGVLGAIVVFAGYLLSNGGPGWLWLASLGLLIHWFGDSLDGTLARVRGTERPRYGFFLDQSIDVVGNLLIMAGLGLSPYARLDVALLALTAYHALTIYSLLWNAVTGRHFVSIAGLGPTEVRILLFVQNTAIFLFGAAPGFLGFGPLTWCDGLLLAGFAVMALIFGFSLRLDARRLLDQDDAAAGPRAALTSRTPATPQGAATLPAAAPQAARSPE
jgi:archaetidylinositol phosphate synthase